MDTVKRFARDAGKQVKVDAVYLFGSAARGAAKKYSDIDVAVVSPDFTGFAFSDRKKLNLVVLKYGALVEVHPFRKKDFTKENPFVREIVRTGIKIK